MEIRRIEANIEPPFPPSFKPRPIKAIPFYAADVARMKSCKMLTRHILNLNGCGFARGRVFSYLSPNFNGHDAVKATVYRLFAKLFRFESIEMNAANIQHMEQLSKSPFSSTIHHLNQFLWPEECLLLEPWGL